MSGFFHVVFGSGNFYDVTRVITLWHSDLCARGKFQLLQMLIFLTQNETMMFLGNLQLNSILN